MGTVNLYNRDAFLSHVVEAGKAGLQAAIIPITASISRTLNMGGPGTPSAPGQPPHKQTGELAGSWQSEAQTRSDMTIRAFSHDPKAKWLEYGAHIRPKNGKLLVYPVSPEAKRLEAGSGTRIGVLVFRLLKEGVLRQIRTDSGWLYVKDIGGKHARSVLMFRAVGAVNLAPRPYIQRSIADAKKRSQTQFNRGFRRVFNAAAPGGAA